MFMQTHLRISEAIIKNLPINLPFQFDKPAFQYGSVVPDLLLGNPDHTKDESIHFVSALLKEVQKGNLIDANPADKRNLFVKLGIVTHYVADYFCQAHNDDPRYQKLLSHMIYENRLRIEFNASNLAQVSRVGLESFNYILYATQSSLVEYIQDRHLAYLAEKPGMSKDIKYAAQISTNVIAAILNNYVIESKRQAA